MELFSIYRLLYHGKFFRLLTLLELRNMDYYRLIPPEENDPDIGIAYAPEAIAALAHPRDSLDLTFKLKDGSFADFLMSDLGWRLFSDTASAIISSFATQDDGLQWQETRVQLRDESRSYSGIWFASAA
jgi:hypothetical protein